MPVLIRKSLLATLLATVIGALLWSSLPTAPDLRPGPAFAADEPSSAVSSLSGFGPVEPGSRGRDRPLATDRVASPRDARRAPGFGPRLGARSASVPSRPTELLSGGAASPGSPARPDAPGRSAPAGVGEPDDATAVSWIAGVVEGPDGLPLPSAAVQAYAEPVAGVRDTSVAPVGARTDADGRFELEVPAGSAWTVEASHPLGGTGSRRVLGDEGDADLRIVLPGAAGLRLQIAGTDGAPIAGAQVTLSGSARSRRHAQSDADGRVALTGLGEGRFDLIVRATGRGTVTDSLSLERGRVEERHLALAPERIAVGRVVDREGAPVEGARIDVRFPGDRFASADVSDADGRFEVRGLGNDAVTLRVFHPGYSVWTESGRFADEEVRVVLLPGVTLDGRVVDEQGAGVAGAFVALTPIEVEDTAHLGARVETSASGGFSAAGLTPGRWNVRASCAGLIGGEIEVVLGGDEDAALVTIVLGAGSQIFGRLVDPEGAAVAAARIDCLSATGALVRGETDAEGAFLLAGVEPGLARITVTAEGYARTVIAHEVAESTAEVTWIVPPAGTITGTVLDGGSPASGTVTAASVDGPTRTRVALDAAGRYRLSDLPPGEYRLEYRTSRFSAPTIFAELTLEAGASVRRDGSVSATTH